MKIQLIALLVLTTLSAFSQKAFQSQPIMPGCEIVPLYPPNSPFLDKTRISEPQKYNTSI
jgi:hypothetical protein